MKNIYMHILAFQRNQENPAMRNNNLILCTVPSSWKLFTFFQNYSNRKIQLPEIIIGKEEKMLQA